MSSESVHDGAGDTMAERVTGGGIRITLLAELNRWLLTGGLLVGVGVALVAVGLVWPDPAASALERPAIRAVFQAMVTSIITGVTLVVSINQLVLSQELGSVGEQQSQLEESLEFRSTVASQLDTSVSPTEPAAFLSSLLGRMQELGETLGNEEFGETGRTAELSAFGSEVARDAASVGTRLESGEFGTFQVVDTALDFNYSAKLAMARRLRIENEQRLSEEADETLTQLHESLALYGTAREHFKTLYFQWELIDLSRALVYAAVPALTVAVAVTLFYRGPGSVPGVTAGVDNALFCITLATLVAITPFMVLISYILRIGTVAKRTLAIGPFVLRETSDNSDA